MSALEQVIGLNGVAITRRTTVATGFRTYEVHQRERVGESTARIKPGQLISPEFAANPYPLLEILREHYPCYRNWVTNDYWLTRYDDVTSVFTDDANFVTRPKRWFYGMDDFGHDFGNTLEVLRSHESFFDAHAPRLAEMLAGELCAAGGGDLAIEFAARLPLELLVGWLNLPADRVGWFATRYWRMQRGVHWQPQAQQVGVQALHELSAYFAPLLVERRRNPGTDLVSVIAGLQTSAGLASAEDLVITLLEWDHETLHGSLANLWYCLLKQPEHVAALRADDRLIKAAYLEALRHSTPVLAARRFARHEVERFGKLLPEGALIMCSAAAANRDPRVFAAPEQFVLDRKDLTQREPRGQYRADGLASGIAFGLGKPSKHPALPEDRPRSLYAINRDVAVTATAALLNMTSAVEMEGAAPQLRCLALHEMHTCWQLPVSVRKK